MNAAYCWVPLFAGERLVDIAERARRLGLFCDASGVDDRAAVIPTMRLRILFIARFVEEQARAGDPGFIKLASMDVPAKMADDAAFLDEHRTTLERAPGR